MSLPNRFQLTFRFKELKANRILGSLGCLFEPKESEAQNAGATRLEREASSETSTRKTRAQKKR